MQTQLVGAFNLENMMIAAYLANQAGATSEQIVAGIRTFGGLPGRQQLVRADNGIVAMIDFALTPDALSTIYQSARAMGYSQVIAVFGATGERDQGKRPLMGQVATEICDRVIITEDENYSEDGLTIMHQVESGVAGDHYELIQDRRAAIRAGLERANPGDIVIVTGMANFTTRSMNEGKIPRFEHDVIVEEMKDL